MRRWLDMNQLQLIGKILTGNWRGKIGDDIVDEYWSIMAANTLIGMFRWLKEGEVSFYEFVVIDNIDGKIRLKIKHFNPDLTGWEEKANYIHYVLRDISDSQVIFGSEDPTEKGRLIYERQGEKKLTVILEMSKSDRTLRFEFDRI